MPLGNDTYTEMHHHNHHHHHHQHRHQHHSLAPCDRRNAGYKSPINLRLLQLVHQAVWGPQIRAGGGQVVDGSDILSATPGNLSG